MGEVHRRGSSRFPWSQDIGLEVSCARRLASPASGNDCDISIASILTYSLPSLPSPRGPARYMRGKLRFHLGHEVDIRLGRHMDQLRNLEASNAFLVRREIRFQHVDVPVHASELQSEVRDRTVQHWSRWRDRRLHSNDNGTNFRSDLDNRWEPRDLLSLFSSLEW